MTTRIISTKINDMDKATKEIQEGRFALVTNTYYMLIEAADMMLRYMERMSKARHAELEKRIKERHKVVLQKTEQLKTTIESFEADYCAGFDDFVKYDNLRIAAALMARVVLLINDRTLTDKVEGENEKRIENYIRRIPQSGLLTDDMLDNFRIR